MFFIYGGMIILSANGVNSIYNLLCSKTIYPLFSKVFLLLVSIMLASSAVNVCLNHPYQQTYYNFLARNAGENYELDYWNVGLKSAIEWITLQQPDVNKTITISSAHEGTNGCLKRTVNDSRFKEVLHVVSVDVFPNYIIQNQTYENIYGRSDIIKNYYEQIYSIVAYGNTLYTIYEKQFSTPMV